MTEPESAVPLYDPRGVVERIEGRSVCGMRVERTGQTSVAGADVT